MQALMLLDRLNHLPQLATHHCRPFTTMNAQSQSLVGTLSG
jgi:hypothetical protein